ncbi:hypothetical protein NQ314_007578, partial [Rhamnusium bicolor]
MNLEVYVGQQPDGPCKVSNSPNYIVEGLCESIKGSGRNLTIDNWFTSVPLVEKLHEEYTLTVIGTIRKNKEELSLEFSHPTHPPGASMFGFMKNYTLPHLRIRVAKENISKQLKNRLREICEIQDIPGLLNRNREGETGSCSVCSSKRNRKT